MSSQSVKVSIVIPVYNVEKYLRQCLDSVVNQTMREIQIICVNDGSTDSSLAILQEYAAKDFRIEIIDKPNGGVASARNAAFSRIKGKYTYFTDSDDWLELDLCEKVYWKAESTGASIVRFFAHNYRMRGHDLSVDDKITALEKGSCLTPMPWDKFFLTSFLFDKQLDFPEDLSIGEDAVFCWKAFVFAGRISSVLEDLYHYRHTPGSLTRSPDKKWICDFHSYQKIYEFLVTTGNYEVYRPLFLEKKLEIIKWTFNCCSGVERLRMIKMFRETFTAGDHEFLCSPQWNDKCTLLDKLFYQMILGTPMEQTKATVILNIRSLGRMVERSVRINVIHPIKKCLKAA